MLAVVFTRTGETSYAVLFSGSKALAPVVDGAATIPAASLGWLLLLKGLAWSLSRGAFRGGGVFPAIFLGTVGGLLADRLPGLTQGAAVAIVMAAAIASVMRLPLSSVVIATGLVSSAGAASATLVVISVVVAYIAVDKIFDRRATASVAAGGPIDAAVPAN
jgi:H+/Cl- antiporter ClcA